MEEVLKRIKKSSKQLRVFSFVIIVSLSQFYSLDRYEILSSINLQICAFEKPLLISKGFVTDR